MASNMLGVNVGFTTKHGATEESSRVRCDSWRMENSQYQLPLVKERIEL